MPELPEVQIQVEELSARLRGRRITGWVSRDPKIKASRRVVGRRITAVTRRAKQILFHLSDGTFVLAHLRMTGWFVFQEPARWRAAIQTSGGTAYFEDSRRFGTMEWVTPAELARRLEKLGPEPLQAGFDPAGLRQTGRSIKVALLDQRLVAGVGNIYASESLWRAQINPRKRARRLTDRELRLLKRGLVAAMRKAIGYGPAIFAVQQFGVYDRAGLPCRRCRTVIRKFTQAQRTTFWCPQCQR